MNQIDKPRQKSISTRGTTSLSISSLLLVMIASVACSRQGFNNAEILPPIDFDDGRLKVSLLNTSAVPMTGSCTEIGGQVTIDGDGFGSGSCAEGGRWAIDVDFSGASEGPVMVFGVQQLEDGAYSSPPTTRLLTKQTEYCDSESTFDAAPFAGGDGSQADPYRICSRSQLLQVDSHLDAHLQLENDIDIGEESWSCFGQLSGVFDGQGFVIENMSFENSDYPSGLFVTHQERSKTWVSSMSEPGASATSAR